LLLDAYGITVHNGSMQTLTCKSFVFGTRVALETAETLEQLGRFPGWKLHRLKGDLKGFWSLTVTGNWRLLFRHNEQTNTASDIDLIDCH
jgi:plasmid maintenance system killer protein